MVAKDDNPDKSESGDKPEKQTSDENEAEEDEDKQTSREQEQIDEVSLRSCSELDLVQNWGKGDNIMKYFMKFFIS